MVRILSRRCLDDILFYLIIINFLVSIMRIRVTEVVPSSTRLLSVDTMALGPITHE